MLRLTPMPCGCDVRCCTDAFHSDAERSSGSDYEPASDDEEDENNHGIACDVRLGDVNLDELMFTLDVLRRDEQAMRRVLHGMHTEADVRVQLR